jgi:hypothetical protein
MGADDFWSSRRLQLFFVVDEGGSHRSSVLPRGWEEIISMCVVGQVGPFFHFLIHFKFEPSKHLRFEKKFFTNDLRISPSFLQFFFEIFEFEFQNSPIFLFAPIRIRWILANFRKSRPCTTTATPRSTPSVVGLSSPWALQESLCKQIKANSAGSFKEKGREQLRLQVQRLPKDMAAAMMNRPGNHAHEPDVAAAVNQIDAPPHYKSFF